MTGTSGFASLEMKDNWIQYLITVVGIVACVVAFTVIYPSTLNKAQGNCKAINNDRLAINQVNRSHHELLQAAASTRERTGRDELASNPTQAAIDFAAAARYRELAEHDIALHLRNC